MKRAFFLLILILTCQNPPIEVKAPPSTLSLYPDIDPPKDRTGRYYSKDKLEMALSHSTEPEKILKIHNQILSFDRWVEQEARSLGISTVTIAIVNDYNVLYQRSINTSIQRKYPVVSFTKPIVAVAVLKLDETGKIKIDDPINRYLPGIIAYHSKWEPVTIRHLLTHTSGVSESGHRYSPPGKVFRYSNNGYRKLGYLIERVTGEPLHRFLNKTVLDPMNMDHTIADYRTDGAAGMLASTVDLRKFLIMHLNKGKFMDKKILSPLNYWRLFITPAPRPDCEYVEYRGIAWRIWTAQEKTLFLNHAALWRNMGGTMQWFPEHNIGWIFMSNPVSHNHPAFRAFYIRIRARLNILSSQIAEFEDNPNYITPCYYHTVSW